MNIDEAIKWNELIIRNPSFAASIGGAEAIQLGIEALEVVKLCRKGFSANVYLLLLGQTKD